jgi:hypothetical protein
MSALAFDPWVGLRGKDAPAAKVANPANQDGREASGLAPLAGLAGVPSSPCEASLDAKAPETDDEPPPLPVVRELQASGTTTVRAIAEALNARGIRTARGGDWHHSTVRNLLAREG